jgi:ankyrin repeat protein
MNQLSQTMLLHELPLEVIAQALKHLELDFVVLQCTLVNSTFYDAIYNHYYPHVLCSKPKQDYKNCTLVIRNPFVFDYVRILEKKIQPYSPSVDLIALLDQMQFKLPKLEMVRFHGQSEDTLKNSDRVRAIIPSLQCLWFDMNVKWLQTSKEWLIEHDGVVFVNFMLVNNSNDQDVLIHLQNLRSRGISITHGRALFYLIKYQFLESAKYLKSIGTEMDSEIVDELLDYYSELGNAIKMRNVISQFNISSDFSRPIYLLRAIKYRYDVHFLLELGADVNKRGLIHSQWLTPMEAAVQYGDTEVIYMLVKAGANLDARNSKGESLLHIAIAHKNEAIILYMATLMPDLNCRDDMGRTALHFAVNNTSKKVITEMIRLGCDPNLLDNNGNSLLHNCTTENAIHALFEAPNFDFSANVNLCNIYGDTPLHMTIKRALHVTGVTDLLIAHGAQLDTPIMIHDSAHYDIYLSFYPYLCNFNSIREMQEYLHVPCLDNVHITPFMYLGNTLTRCKKWYYAAHLFKHLVKITNAHNDFSIRDCFGRHPLHYASINMISIFQKQESLEELIKRVTDNEGKNLLHLMVNRNIKPCHHTNELIESTMGLWTVEDNTGTTPIIWACRRVHTGFITVLPQYFGFECFVDPVNGFSVLHYVAQYAATVRSKQYHYCDTVQVLRQRGVNMKATNHDGETALDLYNRLAATNVCSKAVQVLKRQSFDMTVACAHCKKVFHSHRAISAHTKAVHDRK